MAISHELTGLTVRVVDLVEETTSRIDTMVLQHGPVPNTTVPAIAVSARVKRYRDRIAASPETYPAQPAPKIRRVATLLNLSRADSLGGVLLNVETLSAAPVNITGIVDGSEYVDDEDICIPPTPESAEEENGEDGATNVTK